ncbi:MAG: peptide chain release factor N(5)-glutamine methyltransferase [Thiobacillaceae bacterium]|nr:peptide chain release factor N(5)-glutamine methyltransferase [Thiobacillaceae bacterium]
MRHDLAEARATASGDVLEDLLAAATRRIAGALGLAAHEARLEARVLAAHALGVNRAWLVAHGREALAGDRAEAVAALVDRRAAGEPVAYILGEREFFGLALRVTPDVLIPRPETELLVQLALDRLPDDRPVQVLDLGTGSGAVALAIAARRPLARVLAVDRCPAALAVAGDNAARLGLANVALLASDWYAEVGVKNFDMIVANPPYVAADDPHLTRGDLRCEPLSALRSEDAGLADIRRIVAGAPRHLSPGGWLLFEHGHDQGDACRAMLMQAGFSSPNTFSDLAGQPRVSGSILTHQREAHGH